MNDDSNCVNPAGSVKTKKRRGSDDFQASHAIYAANAIMVNGHYEEELSPISSVSYQESPTHGGGSRSKMKKSNTFVKKELSGLKGRRSEKNLHESGSKQSAPNQPSELQRLKSKFAHLSIGSATPQRNHRSSLFIQGHGSLTKLQIGRGYRTSIQKDRRQQNPSSEKATAYEPSDTMDVDGINKLRDLRHKRDEIRHSELGAPEDEEMDQFEHLYGARLAKAHKKYVQTRQQKKIDADFEQEQTGIEAAVIQRVLAQHETNIISSTKNRFLHGKNKPRRKYFRQPRIYQNNFVLDLYMKIRVQEFRTIPEKQDPSFDILLLFFKEHN